MPQPFNEVRVTNTNMTALFANPKLRLAWTTVLSMPGAQVKQMRKPDSNITISYMTPQDIIDKFNYRFKNHDKKMLQLHGHKWDYMLTRAQELNKEK